MARVEITENRGPEVIDSWEKDVDSDPSKNFGPIVNVRLYTLHSYQVMNDSDDELTFKIIGSNFTDPETGTASTNFADNWTTISTHYIPGNSSLAYSDLWNFKYSSIHLEGNGLVRVYEKHNA